MITHAIIVTGLVALVAAVRYLTRCRHLNTIKERDTTGLWFVCVCGHRARVLTLTRDDLKRRKALQKRLQRPVGKSAKVLPMERKIR